MCFPLARVFDPIPALPALRFPPFIVLFMLGPILLSGISFAQDAADISTYATITDPHTASMIVARVGPIAITAREFLLSYEFGPAFPKRERESKKRYLELMANEKLLALDGYARGIEQSPRARALLGEIEADLATEELYKEDILPRIRVSAAEEERGVHQQLISISLSWLYAAERSAIDTMDRNLRTGAPFDSLARLQGDSLAHIRSMEESRFSLGHSNAAVAAIIDTLRVGIPSQPVKGPDGWYIFLLRNRWTSAVPTESELRKLRDVVRRALLQEKADSLADRYIDRMMRRQKPVIIRSALRALEADIGRSVLSAQSYDAWGLHHARRPPDVLPMDTLVTLAGGGVFRVSDFLQWYRARETALHFERATYESFSQSLQQFTWRMIRDRLLAQRARARGFQRRESVRRQRMWWEQKIVYDLVRSDLEQQVALQDSAVKQFYDAHRGRYTAKSGRPVTFDDVKHEVRRDLFDQEFSMVLLHRLLALKAKYPITVRDSVLARLPVDSDNDPRAIDLYLAKTGGIFPRQAFPTIDGRWQAWQ